MIESRISALVDGELEQEEAGVLLAAARKQPGLGHDWLIYHTIGDAMRQAPPLSPDFNARFAERLEKEPTVLAPHRLPQAKRPLIALSAAASVAAISLVTWAALQINSASEQMAKTAVSEVNQASASAEINSYLVAHQEYSRAAQQFDPYQRASFEKSQGGGR